MTATDPNEILCERALDLVEAALDSPFRRELVEEAIERGSMGRALKHLRSGMQAHLFETRTERHDLRDVVDRLDRRTRRDGFRAMHSWNFRTHEFSRENTPVIMLDYFADIGMVEGTERHALGILLDYYFFHVLTLCAMRAWDMSDPVGYLDRVDRALEHLHGPLGSGHRLVDHAETLLILGLSQFHPEEAAYDRIVEKVWSLDSEARRVRFARMGSAVLASHLRWGFGVMYQRDLTRMRDDNVGDYPWLLTGLLELIRSYDRLRAAGAAEEERDPVVEGLINGLTPDPWALFDRPPGAFAEWTDALEEFRARFLEHAPALLDDFERHRPAPERFSPLDLHYNFPHNALVAKVLIALHKGSPLNLPMDALFNGPPPGSAPEEGEMSVQFARTLMNYSGVNPQGYDQHGAMFVVYDGRAGLRHFNMAMSVMRKYAASAGAG